MLRSARFAGLCLARSAPSADDQYLAGIGVQPRSLPSDGVVSPGLGLLGHGDKKRKIIVVGHQNVAVGATLAERKLSSERRVIYWQE